eukprot:6184510-Pleurochrysis_carterae.AAC.1
MALIALMKPIAAAQFLATNSRLITLPSSDSCHWGKAPIRWCTASIGSRGVSLPQQPPILQAAISSAVNASPSSVATLPGGIALPDDIAEVATRCVRQYRGTKAGR